MFNEIENNINKADSNESALFIYKPDFHIERELLTQGHKIIGGIDEAGRGSLVGPLTVGLTIYSESTILSSNLDLDDSKKLSPKSRLKAYELIKSSAIIAETFSASHDIVDELNVNGATEFSIISLLNIIKIVPDILIIDGNMKFNLPIPYISIKKGDSKSLSIASASIIAKVTRDNLLIDYAKKYPQYGLDKNMGYGTQSHQKAIYQFGGSPIHRRTYDPLKTILSGRQINNDK
jgi:ribonuclease HII